MHPELTDIPETMLWTLHNRAREAARADGCITDPKCLEIYRAIDYDYQAHFGKADGSHGVRSMLFDRQISRFMKEHPDAVIVNLGEGLETQRYRIDSPGTLWVSVDLPAGIDIRERFIAPDERHLHVARNALDTTWFDAVPEGRPVFIAAQGLFMYFTTVEVAALMRSMARKFPGATVMFDYIGRFLSKRTLSEKGWMKTDTSRTPPMPWGVYRNELQPLLSAWLGQQVSVHNVTFELPRGPGKWSVLFIEKYLPQLANKLPGVCWLQLPEADPAS